MPRWPDARTSQRTRQERTAATATRHGLAWTAAEDAELAACVSDEDLEAFALRWGRRFLSVEQRRQRPRTGPQRPYRPAAFRADPASM